MENSGKLSDLISSHIEEINSTDETDTKRLKEHLSFSVECMSFMAARIEKNEEDIKFLTENIEELANASSRIVAMINNIR